MAQNAAGCKKKRSFAPLSLQIQIRACGWAFLYTSSMRPVETRVGILSVMAFHEKAGRSQGNSGFMLSCFLSQRKVVLPPSSHCRHASIRTLEERFVRSVHVGRSRFSRCCHLINDLRFILRMKVGLALDAVTGTRLWRLSFLFLGTVLLCFSFLLLRGCCNCNSTAIVQGLVDFSAHPQVMQQHCQLSCRGHDGPLLCVSSSSFR